MVKYYRVILGVLFLLGCERDIDNNENLIQFIPEKTPVTLISKNFEELKLLIQENKIIEHIGGFQNPSDLDSLPIFNNFYFSGECALGLDWATDGLINYVLIVESDSTIVLTDSLVDFKSETLFKNKRQIDKISIHGNDIYSAKKGNKFIYSNHLNQVENFAEDRINKLTNNDIEKILSGNNSVVLDSSIVKKFFKYILTYNDTTIINNLSDKIILDYTILDESIILNGVTKNKTNSDSFLNYFNKTIAQENQISKFIPSHVRAASSFTFNDKSKFQSNLPLDFEKDSLSNIITISNLIEVGDFISETGYGYFAYSLDDIGILETFPNNTISEKFKNINIYSIQASGEVLDLLLYHLDLNESIFIINVNNGFIFSNKISVIRDCINAQLNESTLSTLDAYTGLMKNMSDESSIFQYYNSTGYNELLSSNFSEIKSQKSKGNKSYAFQFIVDNGFAHVNAVLGQTNISKSVQKITEQFQYKLINEIIGDPQFLENHLSNSMDVAIQDVNNNLILLDNNGKLLFKKALDGKILGKINQLDTFKNGRKQLAFATSSSVYVVSRNGTDVGNFPRRFRDEITQPLSLFDYDNKKNYRLLVTQDDDLFMMDKNGNKVNGFNFQKTSGTIKTQPKHFRLGRKDYLVFAQDDRLRVISRIGKDRIKVSQSFDFSENEIYPYQNKFTFSDKDGNLIQVDQKGKVSRNNLIITSSHNLTTTSKTLVSLNDNILQIRSNKRELEFGNYTAPRIFYLNDKIYVSTTDLQTNKILLFDSQGEPINGFPIYGSSSIDLANIDNDNNLELVVKNGSDGIIVYQL